MTELKCVYLNSEINTEILVIFIIGQDVVWLFFVILQPDLI